MTTNVRYNPIFEEFEANCIGFFRNAFFSLDSIVKRQNEIYSLIQKDLRRDSDTNQALNELYNATEAIRVAIVHSNLKSNGNTSA